MSCASSKGVASRAGAWWLLHSPATGSAVTEDEARRARRALAPSAERCTMMGDLKAKWGERALALQEKMAEKKKAQAQAQAKEKPARPRPQVPKTRCSAARWQMLRAHSRFAGRQCIT